MQAHLRTIIITSCTNRKKKTGEVVSLHASDAFTSIESMAQTWVARVDAAQYLEPIRTLYQGRAFSEAKFSAASIGASLYVASAGHGLIDAESSLPSYDLTVAVVPGSQLQLRLDLLRKTSADWWQTLAASFERPRSLLTLLNDHVSQNCVVLLAMPSAYFEMLEHDFAALNDHQVAQLRLITSSFGATKLADRIRKMVLPYDERLDGCKAYAGTRTDFAQRALRHFVMELRGHEIPIAEARNQVIAAMEALVKPALPSRERRSDDAIEELIQQWWERHNGSQSALLRWLRDDQLVSCEQGRFRVIWQRCKLKRNTNGGKDG